METELTAQHDSRNSFYGKARVRYENNRIELVSYQTMVAYIEGAVAVVLGTHSTTTLRHIKEFLLQNGFVAENKAQIVADYMQVSQ